MKEEKPFVHVGTSEELQVGRGSDGFKTNHWLELPRAKCGLSPVFNMFLCYTFKWLKKNQKKNSIWDR